nr:helix-turn-helix domain-containing protein [Clostridium felsineum]
MELDVKANTKLVALLEKKRCKSFYKADDVKEILEVSKSKAYAIIQSLNKELKDKGYITVAGRVPAKFFQEKYYC